MEEIKWLEITVNAPSDRLEELCARLIDAGLTGLVVEDEAEFRAFLEQNRQYWDYVDEELDKRMRGASRIRFYVTDDAAGHADLRRYAALLGTEYTAMPLTENDWAYSWQKYYKPLAVGEKLFIVPQWEKDQPVPAGRTAVCLNPGLTFGTGSHASTQLCLAALEQAVRPGCSVLDLGCGSGILSIAALMLGAGTADAVDIDPKAVDVAYENAALNGIGRDRYSVRAGDVLSDRGLLARLGERKYDLVLANIVADVIIPLGAVAPGLMQDDGLFLCSGIIDSRAGEVASALERSGLRVTGRREQNGWVAMTARKGHSRPGA